MNVFVVITCSWLHHKNVQAREEAVRREQYKRTFFSQPQKQSITLRCVHTLLAVVDFMHHCMSQLFKIIVAFTITKVSEHLASCWK